MGILSSKKGMTRPYHKTRKMKLDFSQKEGCQTGKIFKKVMPQVYCRLQEYCYSVVVVRMNVIGSHKMTGRGIIKRCGFLE